eukprot:403338832
MAQTFTQKLKTRQGVTAVAWIIGLVIIALLFVAAALVDRSWMLAIFIIISVILSICVLVTIFARYVDSEKFPISAYFNIGMTYFYSLMSIGILAVDLGFSLYNRETQSLEEQESYQTLMKVLWNIIYWGSLTHGTFLNKFFSKYWTSGHFTIGGRIKSSIKNLIKMIVAGIIALAIFGCIAYFAIGLNGINGVKAVLLIMANVYSMLFLVILLAYGLFNLPLYLWKCGDNQHALYKELETADEIRKQYRAALVDFHTKVSQCKNLAANHKNEKNQAIMDILQKEMPEKDLEGQSIGHSQYFQLELKKNQEITEDFIANIRYQFKLAFFMYKRKKSKWLTTYNIVDNVVVKPIEYSEDDIKVKPGFNLNDATLDDLKLKAKPNSLKKIILYRILAVLSLLFCLLVLITEATVIVDPEKTIVYFIVEKNKSQTFLVVIFTILFLAGIVLVCFFTIFNLKMSDYMQLVPKHTDCITFSSVTGMCCKIVTVSCFNYMTLLGEIAPGKDKDIYSTSYVDFYSSMINVPFFGKYFNTIMPLFIIIFGLLFAAMSVLKLKNRAVSAFQNISKSKEDKEIDEKALKEDSKSNKNSTVSKEDKALAKKQATNNVLKAKILKGEKAILAEIDLLKKKEERNKLLKYNNYKGDLNDLESTGTKKKEESDTKKSQKPSKKDEKKSNSIFKSTFNKKSKIAESNQTSLIDSEIGNQSSINRNDSDSDIEEQKQPFEKNEKKQPFGKGFKDKNENQKSNKLDIFKKAKLIDNEDELTQQLIPGGFKKKKINSNFNSRKPSEDQEGYGSGSDLSRVTSFQSNSSSGSTSSKRNSTRQKKIKEYKKEGYLLKRKTKTLFGISQWNKRYAVLENQQLIFYEDHTKKVPRKHIDMGKVKMVNFHYDENAPVKSKKLSKKEKDESRFDIYTPNRTYMMKTEGNSLIESEWWVRILRDSAKAYNPNFNNMDV